jgi:hypothetical protein
VTIKSWLQQQGRAYRQGHDRPLAGYTKLMSVYGAGVLGATVAARALGKEPPERISPYDLLQLTLTTQRVARTVAKDPVTSPLRAPFTEYEGLSAPAELAESVRGHGVKHSVGELLTCPMCLAQWVATTGVIGLVFAPRFTRLALGAFSAVAGADMLQHVYVMLQQATEK